MNARRTTVLLLAATLPMLFTPPAQATMVVNPPLGSCQDRYTPQQLGSGSYTIARDGRIRYILAGKTGQRDVEMDVWRTSRRSDGRLNVDWQIGEHRLVPPTPKAYRSGAFVSRNMGAPVVKVTVHRPWWRGDWSCTFKMARA